MTAPSKLSRLQKIAVLIASLDEEVAASVLQQLEPGLMTDVADMIASLGVISGRDKEAAINDCAKEIIEMGNVVHGDKNTANALLTKAIGEKRAASLLESRKSSDDPAFAGFAAIPPNITAEILSDQQPGIIAVVLSHLSPPTAADVLGMLPEDLRKETMIHMCISDMPSEDIIAHIEEYMDSQLKNLKQDRKTKTGDKIDTVVSILQHVPKAIEEQSLSAIEAKSPKAAEEVRDKLIMFDDIVNLSDAAIKRILAEIGTSYLAVALRNASIDLREKFYRNMSKRAAAAVREEIATSPKMKISDVVVQQKKIVSAIRKLEAAGEIVIGEGGEDYYV